MTVLLRRRRTTITRPAPATISGLHSWFKADTLAGSDGSAVAAWPDSSGLGHTASQGTAASRPTLYTSTPAKLVNGLPAVWFDGSNDALATAAFTALSAGTVFVVGQIEAPGSGYFIDGIASGNRWALADLGGIRGQIGLFAGSSSLVAYDPLPTRFHCWSAEVNGASSKVYRNGDLWASGNAGSHTLTGITLGDRFANVAGSSLNSGLCEVIVYDRVLTAAERQQVEAYLIAKWGLVDVANAASPQTTPSYDGSGQAMHPSVVHFATPWNGYTHVMAMTPYTGSDDDYENPSILASNDGETWEVPAGLTNPIDSLTGASFNSDVDLVYDDDTDRLYCVYRDAVGDDIRVLARYSTDLATWSAEQVLVTSTQSADILSPAVRYDGTTWQMWSATQSSVLQVRTADDILGEWSAATNCTWVGQTGIPWHLDVVYDPDTSLYHLNYCDTPGAGTSRLYTARSTDGVAWTLSETLLIPTASWDNLIHRASIVIDGDTARCWYGARSAAGVWRVGYTEFPKSFL